MRWIAKATAVTGTVLLMAAGGVNAVEIHNGSISEAEVLQTQKAWGEALVAISHEYEENGVKSARDMAAKVIDAAYGYQLGPVLFKPTLTQEPQTFRIDREGALSYFVGQDPKYPNDTDGSAGASHNSWLTKPTTFPLSACTSLRQYVCTSHKHMIGVNQDNISASAVREKACRQHDFARRRFEIER